jgi:hypothetical protein
MRRYSEAGDGFVDLALQKCGRALERKEAAMP